MSDGRTPNKKLLPSKGDIFEASALHNSFTVLQNEMYVKAQSLVKNVDMFARAVEFDKQAHIIRSYEKMAQCADFLIKGIGESEKYLSALDKRHPMLKTQHTDQRKIWGMGYDVKRAFDESAARYTLEKPSLQALSDSVHAVIVAVEEGGANNNTISPEYLQTVAENLENSVKNAREELSL